MGFVEAVTQINEIKRIGLIQEYAIGGAYAVSLYDVPQATYDLDVFVILSSDRDFSRLYDHFRKNGARIDREHIIIGDMPVQFLPNLSPLHDDAVKEAKIIKYNDVYARFVDIEHLILLLLTAFRPKDRLRVKNLLDKAEKDKLRGLIKRFDDEKKSLYEKYRKILEEAK